MEKGKFYFSIKDFLEDNVNNTKNIFILVAEYTSFNLEDLKDYNGEIFGGIVPFVVYNNEYYNFKLDGAMDNVITHSMKTDDKEGGKIKMPETVGEKDKKEPEKPDDKTVGDILEAMTDEQKAVVNYLLGTVAEAYEEDGTNEKNKNENIA